MTKLWPNLRKIYIVLFYHAGFILNIDLNLSIFLPFWVYLVFAHQLTAEILIKTILLMALTSFFYIVVYIINDQLDYAQDKKEGHCKLTAIRGYGMVNYCYGYLVACAILLLLSSWIFSFRIAILFLIYFIVLISAAFIHSKYHKTKPLTIFVERWLKVASPIFLARSMSLQTGLQKQPRS